MIKAVIFDMDGLIVDTEPIQSRAFENIIRSYGKEPIFYSNGLVHEIGIRGDKNFQAMKKRYNIKEEISILRKKRRIEYEKLLQKGINAMPGLIQLLELLKGKGIYIAIASNSPKKHIMSILDALGIDGYFDIIVSGEDVKEGKPNPECYIQAAQTLEVGTQDCLVLEDAQFGVMAAKSVGMQVIAIPTENTRQQDFSKADVILSSLEDITWELMNEMGKIQQRGLNNHGATLSS